MQKMKLSSFNSFISTRVLALLALAMFAPATWAQDDDESSDAEDGDKVFFDEIIVSADRTEGNILDTPMTITGFTSDMLKQMGIQDRDKLQVLVPGLQFGESHDQVSNGTSLRGKSGE